MRHRFLDQLVHRTHRAPYRLFCKTEKGYNVFEKFYDSKRIKATSTRKNRLRELEHERKQSMREISEKAEGERPELKASTKQLRAFRRTGDWKSALKMVEDLETEGLKPDSIIYNAALSVCNHCARYAEARNLYKKMRDRKVTPTIITYNVILTALGNSKQMDEVLVHFSEMKQQGFQPDTITYSAILNACDKCRDPRTAMQIYEEMKAKEIAQNSVTYNQLVSIFSRGPKTLHLAFQFYEELKSRNIKPNAYTFSSLLDGCAKARDLPKAEEIWKEMIEMDIRPGKVTYSCMMKSYCYQGDVKNVLRMFKNIMEYNFTPDVFEYNIVFDALGRKEYFAEVHKLFDEMVATGVRPNDVTFSIILESFVDAGRWEDALLFYERALEARELGHWSMHDPGHVELHKLPAKVAAVATRYVIERELVDQYMETQNVGALKVIVGKGMRSGDKVAKLRPTILSLLSSYDPPLTPQVQNENSGVIEVAQSNMQEWFRANIPLE